MIYEIERLFAPADINIDRLLRFERTGPRVSADMKNVVVVIPAYNEERTIGTVVLQALSAGFKNVVVIDDGSKDATADRARDVGAIVYSHPTNCGVGAATTTGFAVAKRMNADIVVTIDADEQHDASEIGKVIQPILDNEVDIVVGSRFLQENKIPVERVVYNKIGNVISFALSGVRLRDSQSGFRAFSRKALEKIQISMGNYEFWIEVNREIRQRMLRHKEVPIGVSYSQYSRGKGQSFAVGVDTLFRLIVRSLMR